MSDSIVPPGTPMMHNPQIVSRCVNPDEPELCTVCGHATLFWFQNVVFHDDGVVQLADTSVCGSDECCRDEHDHALE